MWDLPTNKANFLFKNKQDFNQTINVLSFKVECALQNAKCMLFQHGPFEPGFYNSFKMAECSNL